MIDITGVDLKKFVKDVYDLSVPQGLGFLHATNAPLPDEAADEILSRRNDRIAVNMDYIGGRACKMIVFSKDGQLTIRDGWYDHTDNQLEELLSRHGIKTDGTKEHGVSCNCRDCRIAQGKTGQPQFSEVLPD